MGAEQADGLINPEDKPTLTEIISSTNEQSISTPDNQTQYYYERKEINSNNIINKKENKKVESTTIIGNRIIQVGKPSTIYEKRVISKTIKKEGNINNNITTTTTQTKIINADINKEKEEKEKINEDINNNKENNLNNDVNYNKINNINSSIKKKNIITYNNPSAKIMHRNIIGNKNFRQKNLLPKTNINVNKSSNYFMSNNNDNKIDINKSVENINNNIENKLLSSTNNIMQNKVILKKIEMPNLPSSQRSHSPDINSIRRKTINRGEEIKNVQITHIICTNKNKDPNFHITEKLSTKNIKTNPIKITIQDRERLKKGGKSTYKSSCTEYRPILTQNLKGKTTIYQHARGIGMTNGRRNSNSIYYTSDIKKFEPILIKKEKEKVEHIENFRSSKYRNINSNTIDICERNGNNKKIIGKEKIINVNDENIENNNGNIIA